MLSSPDPSSYKIWYVGGVTCKYNCGYVGGVTCKCNWLKTEWLSWNNQKSFPMLGHNYIIVI